MTAEINNISEQRRQREQTRLDLTLEAAERNRTGQFATPSLLAEEILRLCRHHWHPASKPIRFLEPCVGTGSFYSALLRVLPNEIIERAVGYELDPHFANAARSLWRESGLEVTQGDFLQQALPRQKFNLLITNPPYVRHHHVGKAQKERLQNLVSERLGLRISGLAGLYCYFLLLADGWLEQGGLAAWLIPSEFMDVNYGSTVKEYLTTRVRLLHLHRFSPLDVQFDNALVSSALVVYKKEKPNDQEVVFSFGGRLNIPSQSVSIAHKLLCPTNKWTQYGNEMGRDSISNTDELLFGDLFQVRRGLATGNNGFFILRRAEAARIELPKQFLIPILPPPRQLSDCVIESNPDGFPQLDPQFALLDCSLAEEEVEQRYAGLWRYLQAGKLKGVHAGYLTSRRFPWYSQENRPPPPFLCTYMGRKQNGRKPFRFLWNKSQATAPNVYLLLYPRGILQEALTRDPSLYAVVFAALQSLDTETITGNGRVYGGGLYKLEPKELANIPAGFLVRKLGRDFPLKVSRQRNLFETP